MSDTAPRWVIRLDGSDLPSRAVIGGKAWSLAHMASLDLPVPPAVVITTAACRAYQRDGALPQGLAQEVSEAVQWLEAQTGRRFGAGPSPLLLAVRSGAPISMPGMMDTVLNLGICDATEHTLASECGDDRFARDTHRRFLDLYARIVLKAAAPELHTAGEPAAWRAAIAAAAPTALPEAPQAQLLLAIQAVFDSWGSRRAKRYRRHHGIDDDLGTAVTLQAMVFGNMDAASGTGVLFSRNPLSGEDRPYGEYLPQAQGEDVVSGAFTPLPLSALAEELPDVHKALLSAATVLESANRDVQDIEFTVERGMLYLLQSRSAKRSPAAAVRTAVEMQAEGLISIDEALARVNATQLRSLLSPRLAEGADRDARVLVTGAPASPGVGAGQVVTDSDEAERRAAQGEAVVLVRPSTSPDDLHGMLAAKAVVTGLGGSTSHAAVVGRALGLPCVVGCGEDTCERLANTSVTVDGDGGRVFAGALAVVAPDEGADPLLAQLLEWAQRRSRLRVLNAHEVPGSARIADLDNIDGGGDPERIGPVLQELAGSIDGARGGAIASDEGVRAALAAGLDCIVTTPRLPALIAALHSDTAHPQESVTAEATTS